MHKRAADGGLANFPPHDDPSPLPSDWIVRFADRVAEGGRVLDVAAGEGRHTRVFLARGHPVVAVDRDASRLPAAAHPRLSVIEADLEAGAVAVFDAAYAGVVVTNYLYRPLLPAIVGSVAPGGWLLYETFAMGNERYGHPRNPDYLLRPGELLEAVRFELSVFAYEHGEVTRAGEPAVVQHIAASRPE
jgi:SAM-dependent methyltransferase